MGKTNHIIGLSILAAGCTLATAATNASAAIVYNTAAPVTKANGDFINGTGIPSNGFAVDTDPTTGISVALKARGRDTGQALSIVNDVYTVSTGLAADNFNPWW